MSLFDPGFEVSTSLLLAESAYDAANGVPPKLPDGFIKIADLVIDAHKLAAHVVTGSPSQHQLFRAMLLNAKHPEIFGIIAQSDAITAVSFRGTLTSGDWLKDLEFASTPYDRVTGFGCVHSGFLAVYDTVQNSLKTALQACAPRPRLLITGHSLGAALATLCAPDLARNLPSVVPEVHTFAGPRVAAPDSADPLACTFARQFANLIPVCIRIVNHWDIVPNLPPSTTFYHHVGTAVSVDAGFTCDLIQAHSLEASYAVALKRLIQQATSHFHMAPVS